MPLVLCQLKVFVLDDDIMHRVTTISLLLVLILEYCETMGVNHDDKHDGIFVIIQH